MLRLNRSQKMGGINHQPCGSYLLNSTKMSRCLSLALAKLELGNVALEDIIIAELSGKTSSIDEFNERLVDSRGHLVEMRTASSSLRQQMDSAGFTDLPTLHKVDLVSLGKSLAESGCISQDHWKNIAKTMLQGGFYKALDAIDRGIARLITETDELIANVKSLKLAADNGNVAKTLEENANGNIRPSFAKLFTSWTDFHNMFLASSLLSTELWYAWNGYGSLVDRSLQSNVA